MQKKEAFSRRTKHIDFQYSEVRTLRIMASNNYLRFMMVLWEKKNMTKWRVLRNKLLQGVEWNGTHAQAIVGNEFVPIEFKVGIRQEDGPILNRSHGHSNHQQS